ncbi:MAG TPA: hypothetical protein VK960_10200 [Acidimicrobiia bacterium]|nr:hypothetical protein [Acidimicrobiia bacterium]
MKRDRRRIYQGLAHRLQDIDPRVTPTTADGIRGLAIRGSLFAGFDPGDGSLMVRLPERRISLLVEAGVGHQIEDAGRARGGWVGIDDPERWDGFAVEALSFVARDAA